MAFRSVIETAVFFSAFAYYTCDVRVAKLWSGEICNETPCSMSSRSHAVPQADRSRAPGSRRLATRGDSDSGGKGDGGDAAHFFDVELNPVRPKMCARAWDYRWSSARFHVGLLRKSDALLRRRDLLGMELRWRSYLRGGQEHADFLRKKTRTGRPCGDMAYVRHIESRTGRDLTPRKPGPRPQKPHKPRR